MDQVLALIKEDDRIKSFLKEFRLEVEDRDFPLNLEEFRPIVTSKNTNVSTMDMIA